MSSTGIPLSGFKECDVRGEYGRDVTDELAYRLGRAIGTVAPIKKIVIGGDFRASTPRLLEYLRQGLLESGMAVFDLGRLSTPAYYFAKRHLKIEAGVMVTASHSPSQWNGFKPILGSYPITPEELEHLKHISLQGDFTNGRGSVEQIDIKPAYMDWLARRFTGLGAKIPAAIFDCGNGATGWVIREVLEKLQIVPQILFETPDGAFPHRSPDISQPGDLAILESTMVSQNAGLGFGFDGDGDRVGVVDHQGRRVPSDRLIAWLAQEMLKRYPGSVIVYDLKLSRSIPETVAHAGGKAIPQKSGHTFIKTAMIDHAAILGGEYSGHLFYRELDGGDDGLYSALLIAALVAEAGKPLAELLAPIPVYPSTPDIRLKYTPERQPLIQKAVEHAHQKGANVVLIDGVRAEYPNGWALMRASVTEPALTFRFEGNTVEDMLVVAQTFLAGVPEIKDLVWEQNHQYIGAA